MVKKVFLGNEEMSYKLILHEKVFFSVYLHKVEIVNTKSAKKMH